MHERHERKIRPAIDEEGIGSDRSRPLDRRRLIFGAHGGGVVNQGRRHSFEHRPHRRLAHPFDHFGGRADVLHEKRHGLAPAVRRDKLI